MDTTSAISAPPQVIDALQTASRRTGTGFDYLYKTALSESGLKSTAKAPTSSASGLFQFIEQTWLQTVKETGPKHGLTAFADDISREEGGRYFVADGEARREILALRDDPVVAAVMAGELTALNRAELANALGREPSDGELYIGHFLGPQGAATLIRAAAHDRDAPAAGLLPAAARANQSIFYDRAGGERSAAQVYQVLVHKHSQSAPMLPAGADPREEVSPFAGVVAFFERLFSGIPDEPRRPAAGAPAGDTPPVGASPARDWQGGYSVVAYWPSQEDAGAPADDPQRRIALRQASETYRAQAQSGAVNAPPAAPSQASDAAWGGGLFTNMERAPGPLILIGFAGRL